MITRTQINSRMKLGLTSPDVSVAEFIVLDIFPRDLVTRMADELKHLQTVLGSIPAAGDNARLQALITEWDAFNQ
jgi:hypothetical protein